MERGIGVDTSIWHRLVAILIVELSGRLSSGGDCGGEETSKANGVDGQPYSKAHGFSLFIS